MRNMVHLLLKIDSIYYYGDRPVPRVNTILSDMINEEYLIDWANRLGFGRKNYREVLELAGEKGTYTHEKIDNFIKTGKIKNNDYMPKECASAVNNAFSAFIKWWNIINTNNKVEIIMNESILIGPLFGGTVDLVIKINGKIYIVDFKTSNQPSFRYHLQLSAYEILIEELYNIHVDGWIILMLNKKCPIFNEILVKRPNDDSYMNYCKETFLSLTDGYYKKMEVMELYERKINV